MYKAIFPLITEEVARLPFHVKSIGGWENQDYISRPTGFPEYQWLYCTRGSGKLYIGGEEYIINEKTGFFFSPGVPHKYYAEDEPWEVRWITFHGAGMPSMLDALGINIWGVYNITALETMEEIFDEIYNASISENPAKGFECSVLAYRFLMELRNCLSPVGGRFKPALYRQLQPVVSFMEKNYHQQLSLLEMANLTGVTPQHLCRLFSQAFGMRPFVYLTRLRLQKAKELIISSESMSIKDVSRDIGYSDASYFCALFKEYEGITPTEFKKMYLRKGDTPT